MVFVELEVKGVSLNSYWGLGINMFVSCSTLNQQLKVLQYGTWHIVGSLAYVQSWRVNFNLDDHGQANYPLWIKFPAFL
jgi:hypothetical protein